MYQLQHCPCLLLPQWAHCEELQQPGDLIWEIKGFVHYKGTQELSGLRTGSVCQGRSWGRSSPGQAARAAGTPKGTSQGHLLVPRRRASGLEHPEHRDSRATSTLQRRRHLALMLIPVLNPVLRCGRSSWGWQQHGARCPAGSHGIPKGSTPQSTCIPQWGQLLP